MNVMQAIEHRRSIKRFADRQVTREQIELLLSAAALAPNHRLTQPWRFYVLGPNARRRYGEALGVRKAKKVADREAAEQVRNKVAADTAALPLMIAVAIREDENPEIREEDWAAAMMAVENLVLTAVDEGLGTHLKTGAIMQDPAARAAVGVPADERIVAVLNVGWPDEIPVPKPRRPATELTHWVD